MTITLTGDNEFAIRQTVRTLVAAFEQKYGAHGIERVDADTLEPRQLPSLLMGVTLFSDKRLIILRGAAANKPFWEALGDYIEKVPADTVVIIVEPTPDKRTRTYKLLKAKSDFREFPVLGDAQLVQWVTSQVKEVGASISRADAQYLVERAGRDQWRLSEEIKKLASFNPVIDRSAIDTLVEPSPEGTAFALLDAALSGQTQQVIGMIDQLKTQEDPYKLFGLLASQVHTLAVVVMAEGRSADQIAKEAGLHPFVVRKTVNVAQRLGKERVAVIARSVARCDIQLKSTGADPWDLLRVCLQKVAG